jgi:hypothetical protein
LRPVRTAGCGSVQSPCQKYVSSSYFYRCIVAFQLQQRTGRMCPDTQGKNASHDIHAYKIAPGRCRRLTCRVLCVVVPLPSPAACACCDHRHWSRRRPSGTGQQPQLTGTVPQPLRAKVAGCEYYACRLMQSLMCKTEELVRTRNKQVHWAVIAAISVALWFACMAFSAFVCCHLQDGPCSCTQRRRCCCQAGAVSLHARHSATAAARRSKAACDRLSGG